VLHVWVVEEEQDSLAVSLNRFAQELKVIRHSALRGRWRWRLTRFRTGIMATGNLPFPYSLQVCAFEDQCCL